MAGWKHLFGPVPSRRLGASLGIDLVPLKTCSFNCLFCQLGNSPGTRVARGEYVPTGGVLAELRAWRAGDGTAEVVTLAGSGEPTLHVRFGEVLRAAREITGLRTVLLSNGSLFSDPAVRADACAADIVKVSLGAWDQASLERLNRPHPGLRFEVILDGYLRFREVYRGTLWIGVFLVPGINADDASVRRIAECVRRIGADEVQLNTAVRPVAERSVHAIARSELDRMAGLFEPCAMVIAAPPPTATGHLSTEALAELVARHPMSAAELAAHYGVPVAQAEGVAAGLVAAGRLVRAQRDGITFYRAP